MKGQGAWGMGQLTPLLLNSSTSQLLNFSAENICVFIREQQWKVLTASAY